MPEGDSHPSDQTRSQAHPSRPFKAGTEVQPRKYRNNLFLPKLNLAGGVSRLHFVNRMATRSIGLQISPGAFS